MATSIPSKPEQVESSRSGQGKKKKKAKYSRAQFYSFASQNQSPMYLKQVNITKKHLGKGTFPKISCHLHTINNIWYWPLFNNFLFI